MRKSNLSTQGLPSLSVQEWNEVVALPTVEKIAQRIKEIQSDVLELHNNESIGKIHFRIKREHFFRMYRLTKDNSKDLYEAYNRVPQSRDYSLDVYFRNHQINRLMNESESGKNTQLRMMIEGLLGICVIPSVPMGWSNGSLCEISSVDKGNWVKGHIKILADRVTPPELKIQPWVFQKTKFLSVITKSSAFQKSKQLKELYALIDANLDSSVEYTLTTMLRAIGQDSLINDYLNNEISLEIQVADEDTILKEMIDINNIYNLWRSVIYATCSIMRSNPTMDFGPILETILDSSDSSYRELLRNSQLFKKLQDDLDSCKEFYLLPAMILEVYRKGSSTISSSTIEKKKFMELCEKYKSVDDVQWSNSKLVKYVDTYLSNPLSAPDFNRSINFLSNFTDSDVQKAMKKFNEVMDNFEKVVTYHSEVGHSNEYKKDNLPYMKFKGKNGEQFQLYVISLIYNLLSQKQSVQTNHIEFLIKYMTDIVNSSYKTTSYGEVKLLNSEIKDELRSLISFAGWEARSTFASKLFEVAETAFDVSYGKTGSLNNMFKTKEVENISKLWKETFNESYTIPMVFPTGNLNKNEYIYIKDITTDFSKLDWAHIVSGTDKYPNGYLWSSIQRGQKASSKYVYQSKLEAYKMMVKAMADSGEVKKSVVSLWEDVFEHWENNYKPDLSDLK
jgi:hypothetical protein